MEKIEELTIDDKKEEIKEEKHEEKKLSKKDKHLQEKIKELESVIQKRDNEISELKDNVLREKAELINFKKRKEDETAKILKYCNEDMVKEILPILDNFERAIDMASSNPSEEVQKYFEGIKMTYCHLSQALEKFGVIPIDGSNKPFDPVYHQALMLEHQDGVEAGWVLDVLQKGYLLKDRVIRPAMVKVSE